ncbi:MAG TPA: HDOD domain-containing protein [Candidatus Baltobacteraceae bacterium]|jgi:putative nucleotidyltransferase with HDIG domain|nr:HDOD domain-containing protein [Candidatus Baltobacteraceae bacterium]
MNFSKPTIDYQDAVAQKIRQERLRVLNPAKRYLDGVTSLPPAPMLVTELLALFRQPDYDVDQVVQLISYEPSLTAQILRISNSALFAGEQPPSDIFEAVSRVGFYQIYCLVVSLFGARTRSIEGADKGVNVDQLWRHSVAVAVSTSVVAEESGQTRAVAFTAGLLHDIGKLVLASAERESYAKLIQRGKDEGVLLTALERSALIIDHAELGGELMRRWNLPPDVVAAVRYHHELEAVPRYEQLTAAVQVGDMIAHQLFAEDLAGTDLLAPSTAAFGALQFSPEDLVRLVDKARAEMEKVNGMFEL